MIATFKQVFPLKTEKKLEDNDKNNLRKETSKG
jgi:hypothetical protein